MTSKTSFFNKGIYKSTLKRFTWGAVLYFVILFLSTSLSIITTEHYISHDFDYYSKYPLILEGAYTAIPQFLALVVPTVTALLAFRFIHSKKQVVFTHSLPVSRKANYISSLLGGFTLMAVPVILNALILMLISLCGYGDFFTVGNCLTWLGINMLGIFMMYSCAVLSATVTGNSFAVIVINILIHSFLYVAAAALGLMAEAFVYGISNITPILETLSAHNFAFVTLGVSDSYFREVLTGAQIAEFLTVPVVIYIASYFIYKYRKSETASDVAGYKRLNSVFKYVVTFLMALLAFALFGYSLASTPTAFFTGLIILSAIAYFGAEMLLKKTLNVFYAYKGYLGFAVFFAIVMAVFACTSFFGYETRVPEPNEVSEVAIYNYYYSANEPFSDDSQIKEEAIRAHAALTKDIPLLHERDSETRLHIKYKLKNGKTLDRVYPVTYKTGKDIMNTMYGYEEYKKLSENVFIDEKLITRMYVNGSDDVTNKSELLEVLRTDVTALSYDELHPEEYSTLYDIRIEYEADEKDDEYTYYANSKRVRGANVEVNSKFVNTLKWLKENGYDGYNASEYEE